MLGITLNAGEHDQGRDTIRKGALSATHHLARLEFPDLVVGNGAAKEVFVLAHMRSVYRAPHWNPFVEKRDVDYLCCRHGPLDGATLSRS